MNKEALELFGTLLMTQVRDQTILVWDNMIDGQMKGETAVQVKAMLTTFDAQQREILKQLMPKVIDDTLHYFLWMFEQEASIGISVQTKTELVPSLNQISDGLAGELYGKRGWITKFSKQRRGKH